MIYQPRSLRYSRPVKIESWRAFLTIWYLLLAQIESGDLMHPSAVMWQREMTHEGGRE